ncbi:J domain-containing protein [Streptomyces sudanensis]|uniref:J domain-containing protein n=1 Tax=Streptomyces sudanensis TaxID=436397 RepID=UPI0020CE5F44|nr:J domain-containing protein [Streptomyces sudanensis]MCP9960003.1 J domain-containing protein [Streptomyces sudanensis]MCP9999592.1 J domain-containing protein [Streptomyces sudanensis]
MTTGRDADGARRDPYAVLGVAPTASARQITSAYRRLVRALHPDGAPGRDETERRASAGRLDAVVAAYGVLRDPARRAAYDAGRRRAPETPGPGPAARPTPRAEPPAPGGGLLWVGPVRIRPPR